jgi:transposase InsO family protein
MDWFFVIGRSSWYTSSLESPRRTRVQSFEGRLGEESLRVSSFYYLFDARKKIALWRSVYNEQRPQSSLKYLTPAKVAAQQA